MSIDEFEEKNSVAFFYVKSALLRDMPMLPSLAWFQNNCYINAAVHVLGALCMYSSNKL